MEVDRPEPSKQCSVLLGSVQVNRLAHSKQCLSTGLNLLSSVQVDRPESSKQCSSGQA